MSDLQAGLVLLAVVVLFWALMWWGWRRRADRHALPELVPVPDKASAAILEDEGRYYGTTVADSWLERVSARGLGTRSPAGLRLSDDGLDVLRPSTSFRIRTAALRAARHDQGLAGKVVPPHGLLVVTWQHGDLSLDSGFRLSDITTEAQGVTETHDRWIAAIDRLVTTKEDLR